MCELQNSSSAEYGCVVRLETDVNARSRGSLHLLHCCCKLATLRAPLRLRLPAREFALVPKRGLSIVSASR